MEQALTSMKMDKKELKNTGMSPVAEPSKPPKGPQFPWGLQVTLEDSSLKKMGIKLSDFKVGDIVELYAQCKVTRLSETARDGEENPNRTMELQITDMCLEATDETAEEEKQADDEMDWDEDASKVDRVLKKRGF